MERRVWKQQGRGWVRWEEPTSGVWVGRREIHRGRWGVRRGFLPSGPSFHSKVRYVRSFVSQSPARGSAHCGCTVSSWWGNYRHPEPLEKPHRLRCATGRHEGWPLSGALKCGSLSFCLPSLLSVDATHALWSLRDVAESGVTRKSCSFATVRGVTASWAIPNLFFSATLAARPHLLSRVWRQLRQRQFILPVGLSFLHILNMGQSRILWKQAGPERAGVSMRGTKETWVLDSPLLFLWDPGPLSSQCTGGGWTEWWRRSSRVLDGADRVLYPLASLVQRLYPQFLLSGCHQIRVPQVYWTGLCQLLFLLRYTPTQAGKVK